MAANTDLSIQGATIREDVTVPAREPWSIKMGKGEILRIVDLEGQQELRGHSTYYVKPNSHNRYCVPLI